MRIKKWQKIEKKKYVGSFLVQKSASFQTKVDSISQGMTQEKRGNTNTNSNKSNGNGNSNGSNRPLTNEVRKK